MAEGQVKVIFLGDSKDLRKELGKLDDASKDTEGRFSKMSSGMAVGIGAAVGVMAPQLLAAGGALINTAKELDILSKKVDTVFGDEAEDVRKWADSVNESMGLSDEKVAGLAANLGDLLVPLGFTREAAAKMSTEMIDLSGALSAWSGGTKSASEVTDIMTKAMLGETDGLKALGISMSAAEIDAKALSMGLVKSTVSMADVEKATLAISEAEWAGEKATMARTDAHEKLDKAIKKSGPGSKEALAASMKLSDAVMAGEKAVVQMATAESKLAEAMAGQTNAVDGQAKAQAVQQLIMEKSTDAQKAWTDGTMDATKRQNENKAAVEEAKVAIGEGLLKAYTAVQVFIAQTVIPTVQALLEWMSEHREIMLAVGIVIGGALVAAFLAWAAAAAAAAAATLLAMAPVLAIGAAIAGLAAGLIYAYTHSDRFKAIVDAIGRFLRDDLWPILQMIGEYMVKGWTIQFNIAKGAVEGMIGPVKAVVGFFQDLWDIMKKVIDAIKKLPEVIDKALGPIDEIVGKVGGIVGKVGGVAGKLNPFADGGIVPGAAGAPMPILAHGGEVVFNREQQAALFDALAGRGGGVSQGGGSETINLVVDGRVLATVLRSVDRRLL